MADENTPSDSLPLHDSPKKETVRITLPPKPSDTPTVKRETVRINVPGRPPEGGGAEMKAPPAPASKPFIPPPPAPKPPSGGPPPPMKPAPGSEPPRPPGPPPKPTVALKGPPAPSAPGAPPIPPTGTKPAQPKKETARIQIPPEPKPMMPKATVRMQQTQPMTQTQPLAQAPSASIRTVETGMAATEAADPMVGVLSWAAVAVSLIALAISYLAYSAV